MLTFTKDVPFGKGKWFREGESFADTKTIQVESQRRSGITPLSKLVLDVWLKQGTLLETEERAESAMYEEADYDD